MARQPDSPEADSRLTGASSTTRKIQLAGGSTYTVSLPKEWADAHGIQAGTEVSLHPHSNGSLVVQTEAESTHTGRDLHVSVEGLDPDTIARLVRVMYVAGYGTITLVADSGFDDETRRTITAAATTLLGSEAVTESDTRIVIGSLLDVSDVSVKQSLLRLQRIALEMHRKATGALFEGSSDADHVIERSDEADRLFTLIARHFNRGLVDLTVIDQLGVDRRTLFGYHTTARQLAWVAEYAETLAVIAGESNETMGDGLTELAYAVREIVGDATTACLGESSTDNAYDILTEGDAVLADLRTRHREHYGVGANPDYRLPLVTDNLLRTAVCGRTIAEAAIRTRGIDSE